MSVFVDKPGILAVVVSAMLDLGTYAENELPPIYWTEDAGDFLERQDEMGGAFVLLSFTHGQELSQDIETYDAGDPDDPDDDSFSTTHTSLRRGVLTLVCESDPGDAQNTAGEILEHLRTRLVERPRFIEALVALGVSPILSSSIQDLPATWDGRSVTGAALDVTCMYECSEVDATEGTYAVIGGSEFFRKVSPLSRANGGQS